jgi:hypothetical protein
MLTYIFGTSRNIYYDGTVKYIYDSDYNKIFQNIGISELIVLGDEEDDLWT